LSHPELLNKYTLEFSNTTPLPARNYANEGNARMRLFESEVICETPHRDRGGKSRRQISGPDRGEGGKDL